MKKALSFAVALGLAAGMAAPALASDILEIHGDARWRGLSQDNADANDAAVDSVKGMDQRYRLVANVNVNEDLMIGTRVVLMDQMFGDNMSGTAIDVPFVTADANADGLTDGVSTNRLYVDRAYMQIKMLGGTWLIGRQDASWGNKFLGWGNAADRIKAVYKNGDLTYGAYLQKNREAGDNNDKDTYAGFVVGKAGETKWGVLANYIVDHGAVAPAAETGQLLDIFFNTKAGAVSVMGEVVYKGGDLNENIDGDAAFGGFVGAHTNIDAMTVKGLVAYYQNNGGAGNAARDCDNDFAPSLLIGTCQESAIIDFGGTTSNALGQGDDQTYLVGAGVDMKINDQLTVGGLLAWAHLSDYLGVPAPGDKEIIEIDLTASYVLAKGVTYKAGIAYGLWDGASATDDDLISFSNNISVAW